jgi:Nickel responsive protein SCO4226-like
MPRYLIERHIPALGARSAEELRDLGKRSNAVLQQLGPSVQWVYSYLTRDRMYCVYVAPDEALLREHALLGGFPADQIMRIVGMMDPTSAE